MQLGSMPSIYKTKIVKELIVIITDVYAKLKF